MNYLDDSLAFIPKKQDWLQDGNFNEEWKSSSEIREELVYYLSNKRSPLIWIKRNDRVESAFVVWWDEHALI